MTTADRSGTRVTGSNQVSPLKDAQVRRSFRRRSRVSCYVRAMRLPHPSGVDPFQPLDVVGLGTADTGPVEKVVLVAFGGLLILAALRVHKLGTGSAAS
jgi:hypothetical protein